MAGTAELDDEVLPAALGTLALLRPDKGADRTVDITDEGKSEVATVHP
ncbi:hypothetical protein ACIQPR_45415 [Streptomyces sp. NPDC091280]